MSTACEGDLKVICCSYQVNGRVGGLVFVNMWRTAGISICMRRVLDCGLWIGCAAVLH